MSTSTYKDHCIDDVLWSPLICMYGLNVPADIAVIVVRLVNSSHGIVQLALS
jgi:hypothetical protein